jgi:hypothetical protein
MRVLLYGQLHGHSAEGAGVFATQDGAGTGHQVRLRHGHPAAGGDALVIGELVYGKFTEAELAMRGADRYLLRNGRHYRITDLVQCMDGTANYQAVETDEPVPKPTLQDMLLSRRSEEDVADHEAMATAISELTVQADEAVVWREDVEGYVPPKTAPVGDLGPPLKTWAKDNGWKGRGPISQFVRNKYVAEFGRAAYDARRE